MRGIFSKLLDETDEMRSVTLVTAVSENGHAPKGGSAMLFGENGRIAGYLGVDEPWAEKTAAELFSSGESALRTSPSGTKVLFSHVNAEDMRWSMLAGAVCDRIMSGKPGRLILPLDGGVPSLYGEEGLLSGEPIPEADLRRLCSNEDGTAEAYLALPLPRIDRVVIFGAGDIAKALVPMLGAVDFSCVVLDDRPAAIEKALFPCAGELRLCDYSDIASAVTLTSEDYVIIMTDGHAADLTVEEQVLRSPYAYVGAVGSRRDLAEKNRILTEHGIAEEAIRTVHCPIGLSIRASSSAEIAVSILAELIQTRAEIRDLGLPDHWPAN